MTIKVYAHDSGQRFNWGYSRDVVELDRLKWIETAQRFNNMPMQCIGNIKVVDLSEIDHTDVYVG